MLSADDDPHPHSAPSHGILDPDGIGRKGKDRRARTDRHGRADAPVRFEATIGGGLCEWGTEADLCVEGSQLFVDGPYGSSQYQGDDE
jgi:hypothetical protein